MNGYTLISGKKMNILSINKKTNMNNIKVDELILGKNVHISESASIRGLNGNSKKIVIGDNTYIGDNVQIIIDELTIGDYCKIHHHTNIHGYKPLNIGHNAWVGQGTIIDSIGGVTIGNNCGIGAYSQLWSHIRYGDPLEGCNYESNKQLIIGNDVWFVGHCIVSPIIAKDKSMALVGSVVTKDMDFNHIYGGSPAVDLTEKIKPQFREITIEEKRNIINCFDIPKSIKIIESDYEIVSDEFSYFNISNRTYTKKGTSDEILFMKQLQNKLIKFIPKNDN
jgi:acetyltransferase-like isoleucine patch superfamily enzyme